MKATTKEKNTKLRHANEPGGPAFQGPNLDLYSGDPSQTVKNEADRLDRLFYDLLSVVGQGHQTG